MVGCAAELVQAEGIFKCHRNKFLGFCQSVLNAQSFGKPCGNGCRKSAACAVVKAAGNFLFGINNIVFTVIQYVYRFIAVIARAALITT